MLNRFTVVLDIACLNDGLDALGRLLGLDMQVVTEKYHNADKKRASKPNRVFKKLTPRGLIGYDDVYEYLLEKNRLDIQLYEYSETISLVDCNS